MPNSGTVTAGSVALASQYNNLRSDVLDATTSHVHSGSADAGAKIEGSYLKSTGATNGQVLAADGAGGAAFTTLAGAGALSGTVVDVVWTAGTVTSTTYAAGVRASWGVSGGGTELYAVSYVQATGGRDIYRFNLNSAVLAASTTNTLAVGGTLQFVETMGYGFASGTAMHYSEDVALTTSGNRTITLRKYNNTLASNMWNATIWNAKTDASSYNTRPFYQGNYAYVSSIGIHYSWDSYNADSAGTSLVYVVNDVSGSVYTAPFFVSSATSRGGVNFALYVPPVAAGNGTIYAWGTSVTATGSTVSFHRIAYEVGSASISAVSTATTSYGWAGFQKGNTTTSAPIQPIFNGWWDSACTAIVLNTRVSVLDGYTSAANMILGLDRTAGTVLFQSRQTSGTILAGEERFYNKMYWDQTTRLYATSSSDTQKTQAIFRMGTAGAFYQPRAHMFRRAGVSNGQPLMGFAGDGSATHHLYQSTTLGSSIVTNSFANNIVEATLLPAYAKGRLVFFDENQSDRWRPVTLVTASGFPFSQFIGSPWVNSTTPQQFFTGGDFPLYVPPNEPLIGVFSRNAIATSYTIPVDGDAGTAKFSLKIIEMA